MNNVKCLNLNSQSVLEGYDAVCELYPYVPPLSHWRAWEYAAYQNFEINGRILDLGCGDGRYFKLLWPQITDVVGVDMEPVVAELGKQSGVYRQVHVTLAHQVPEQDSTFDYVFANCSLEHMDNIHLVLAEVYRCLKPGGHLLCSVVTDRFLQWSLLENLVKTAGFDKISEDLKSKFLDFHNLVNPLSVSNWEKEFAKANMFLKEHIPILPKYNSGIFLLMDSLWHVEHFEGGEMGKIIRPFLSRNPSFPQGFRKMLEGLLEMENDWNDCSGAVFLVTKPT
ncbi:MAG: class I SAM-dependent methyltransferase [Bacteroidota bacterium]